MSPAPWAAHFGLARTPFGKSIPARDLFPRQAHAEAIARISFCVVESALGVVTGDVGAGKTVALRAAVSDPRPDPAPGDLHRQPGVRHPRAVRHHRPGAGRPAALPQGRADGPGRRPARRRGRRTAPPGRAHLRLFRPVLRVSATSGAPASGGVTALLTCRARDVRDVRGSGDPWRAGLSSGIFAFRRSSGAAAAAGRSRSCGRTGRCMRRRTGSWRAMRGRGLSGRMRTCCWITCAGWGGRRWPRRRCRCRT